MKTNQIEVELRKIARANGGILKPEIVVESARPKASPLHSRFEWDDGKAGDAYRLWQARQLIKVVVEIIPGMNEATEVFVSLSPDRKESGYRITTEVLSDEQLREQLLQDALAEMNVFRIKYARLKELSGVFNAIDKARRRRRGSARRVEERSGAAGLSRCDLSRYGESGKSRQGPERPIGERRGLM